MHLLDLVRARAADLEDNIGLLPDRSGTVDQSRAGLIVGSVWEISLRAGAALNNDLGKALFEQKDDILRRDRNASLVGISLPGDANN